MTATDLEKNKPLERAVTKRASNSQIDKVHVS